MKRVRGTDGLRRGLSPPARGRGLKPVIGGVVGWGAQSPPARGRGLKPHEPCAAPHGAHVAPRAGAWIETDPPWKHHR